MNNLRPLLVDQLSFLPAASPVDVGSYIYLVDGTTSKRCTVQNLLDLGPQGAIPTNSVGLVSGAGIATTFLRSDCLLAIDQTIAPTWTNQHTFAYATTYFGAAAQAATLRQVAPASGAGNSLTITASAAASGDTNGGNLYLSAGAKSGSGTNGRVVIKQLSANDTNLRLSNSAETAYCDLKIVTDTLQFAATGLTNGYVFDNFVRKNNGRWRLGDTWIEAAGNAGTRGFGISSGDAVGSPDTALERSSAGVWKASNASSGYGAFICGQPAVGTVGLTVNQITSGTANLANFNDSVGTALTSIDAAGSIGIKTSTPGAAVDVVQLAVDANRGFFRGRDSSSMSHGITSYTGITADTFLNITKTDGGTGGARILGINEVGTEMALLFDGWNNETGAITMPPVIFRAAKRSGTAVTTLASMEPIAQFRNWTTTVLTLAQTEMTFADSLNAVFNTTTGTKLGTGTTQKLSLWNATPIVQPAGIVDADGTLADITTKFNSLLAKLESFGLLAVA